MNYLIEQTQLLFAENPAWRWVAITLISGFIALTAKLILKIVARRLRSFSSRTQAVWDDVGVDLVEGLKTGVIFAWAFFLLAKPLNPSASTQRALLIAIVVISIFQVGIWGIHLLRTWNNTVLKKKIEADPSSTAALGLLYTAAQTAFISIIILIGLSNLGINISALLAGLGVGGIAVALAAQNVLGDLLASLSIVLDKPFVVGDFIVADSEKGVVEHIGIKTTRLRSLSGEQLVLSNKDLLESRIHNYKRMWQRRVVQSFGVVYSTPADVLEKIPVWVKGFVDGHEKLKFDRCHFSGYGASSLDFELVFFVSDPEYNVYMDLQQKVLLDIFRKFAQEGVDFAFPTQSLYIEKLPDIPRS